MAIGLGQPGFDFSQEGISTNAPHASGVYAIYNGGWIYVGESQDIQRRLLEHLNDVCIMQSMPTGFTYELVANEDERLARRNELIAQFGPACNLGKR